MGVRNERGLKSVLAQSYERATQARPLAAPHEVAIEEPLELRVAGDSLMVTMRTPGDDRFLALGFLFGEGLIRGLSEVGSVFHCGRTDQPGYGNAIEVTPAPGVALDLERLQRARRSGLTHSACGVCGRDGIDDLLVRLTGRVLDPAPISADLLRRVPELLRAGQAIFARTGGVHGACAIDPSGEVGAHAEDVGRHNAVDKVIGRLLYAGALTDAADKPRPRLLATSSRASFEIVQKAATAGFSCLATLSAPSSLAVETAQATGITLASFVREGRFTLYSHPERVV